MGLFMLSMYQSRSVYLRVAGEVAEEIKNGHFRTGDRLYSQKELCDKFEISGMTAVRVQDSLAKMGLVRKVRGSGVFVNYMKNVSVIPENSTALKRVVFITYSNNQWVDKFQAGIKQRTEHLGLDFRVECINPNMVSTEVFSAYPTRRDEGYIVVSTGAGIHFATGALLFSPLVRSVLIDFIIPGSPCVLTDNFDGIEKLIEHAVSLGHRRFLFASNYNRALGAVNSSERELAFKLVMKYRKLEGNVVASGKYDDIVNMLKSQDAPTSILFPQDDSALRCQKILKDVRLKKIPLIMGFDDFAPLEEGLEHLSTIRIDFQGMGATAVDILPECGNDRRFDKIVRVPGELIVRE